ncbi:hypothetical protein KY285_023971 [Solanum tuberosum]|nr:hypothetical protein KY289_024318 [Solanum tuberosum]KAH0676170.1 hypothetical protein KY285_023971 [Solanum tuberosum]
MRSLSACVDGQMFFEVCNIFLQLWAIEHFYLWSDAIFLIKLKSCRIQWKLYWLSTPHAIVRGDDHYFIKLIGLKCVQPYTPLQVLRQFGRTQVIPLRSDLEQFKYEFGLDKPQVHNILRRWERVLTIPMGARQALCIREYYIWILKEVKDRKLSGEGYYGLTDERENIWARNVLKIRHEVIPYRRSQLAPSSWNRYLQDFRI